MTYSIAIHGGAGVRPSINYSRQRDHMNTLISDDAVMLAGGFSSFRVTSGFSQNNGWQGLLVALLARSRPLAAIPMAILFAALRTGSGFLATTGTGVDRKIVDVVQALLVLALLIPPAVQFVRERRRAVAQAAEEA